MTAPRCSEAEGGRVLFWCPGCEEAHVIGVGIWTWNGSVDAPTFSPSVLVGGVQWARDEFPSYYRPQHASVAPGADTVCHSFVTDGRIQFLADCTHTLAGQTVDLPAWPPASQEQP